jgi:hypothetical protein
MLSKRLPSPPSDSPPPYHEHYALSPDLGFAP